MANDNFILSKHQSFDLCHLDNLFRRCGAVEDFNAAIAQQRLHSAGDGGFANLVGGSALEREVSDLAVHLHHLEDAQSAAEPDARAILASAWLIERFVLQIF